MLMDLGFPFLLSHQGVPAKRPHPPSPLHSATFPAGICGILTVPLSTSIPTPSQATSGPSPASPLPCTLPRHPCPHLCGLPFFLKMFYLCIYVFFLKCIYHLAKLNYQLKILFVLEFLLRGTAPVLCLLVSSNPSKVFQAGLHCLPSCTRLLLRSSRGPADAQFKAWDGA